MAAIAIRAITAHVLSAWRRRWFGLGGSYDELEGLRLDTLDQQLLPRTSGEPSALRACQSSPSTKTRFSPRTSAGSPTSRCEPTATGTRRTCAAFVSAKPNNSASVPAIATRHGQRDLVRVARRIEEHQRADHEHDRAGDGERTVRDDERLGDEEAGREQHQQQAGRGDRQHLQPVEADDQRDRADGAGEDEAGVPELDDDADQADREHQRDDVRVDQEVEQPLPGRQFDPLDLRVGRRRDRQPLRLGRHPVDLAEEVRVVGRDHVDHVQLQRLAGAEVRRLRDHLARHLDVPAVLTRELADVGGGVVDDLAAQVA